MACPTPAADAGDDLATADKHFLPITSNDLLAGRFTDQTVWLGWSVENPYPPSTGENFGIDEPVQGEMFLAGDPVTICYVDPSKTTYTKGAEVQEFEEANYAVVKTAEGKRRWIDTKLLSARPLAYSLRKTGAAEDLIKNMYREAMRDAKDMLKVLKDGKYNVLEMAIKTDKGYEPNETARQGKTLDEAIRQAEKHLGPLVRGGHGRAGLMEVDEFRWLVNAEDPKALDWYVDGTLETSPEGPDREKMHSCVQGLENVYGSAMTVRSSYEKMEQKPWRERLQNASEAQLKKLDEEEMKNLQVEIDRYEGIITAMFENASCAAALKYVGE